MAEHHDTTEEYLEAILEIEEEGVDPDPRPPRRAARPLGPGRLRDRQPPRRARLRRAARRPHPPPHRRRAARSRVSIVRRHRLAERLLVDIIGLEWEKVHKEADRWEHAISADVEEKLVALLGDPATCPHGNPIPGSSHKVEGPGVDAAHAVASPGPSSCGASARRSRSTRARSQFLVGAELIPGSNAVIIDSSPAGVRMTSGAGENVVPKQDRPVDVGRTGVIARSRRRQAPAATKTKSVPKPRTRPMKRPHMSISMWPIFRPTPSSCTIT